MQSLDEEIASSLYDSFAPETATEWIIFQGAMESSLLERVKWLYYASLGKTLEEAQHKVNCIEAYAGGLRELLTAKPAFLRIRGHYETIEDAIGYAELLVLADELAVISFAGKDYVLICHEALVEHYRSLHN